MKKLFLFLIFISSLNGMNISSEKEQKYKEMETQVDSWVDKLGMPIDPKIKNIVIILNLLDFKTDASCEGHCESGEHYPWVSFAEDSNIDAIRKKAFAIWDLIIKKEGELLRKYNLDLPQIYNQIDLEKDEPDLKLLFDQYHNLNKQVRHLEKGKIFKLHELLDAFYKKRNKDYDRMLYLQKQGNLYFLANIGSEWQIARDEKLQAEKMKEYQEEMQLFAKFLKDYWLESK